MSHVIELSDEEYRTLIIAAGEQGQSVEHYLHALVKSLKEAQEHEERDPDQAWFWTPEWQAKEREADADIAAGRLTRFETIEEMFDALDAYAAEADAKRERSEKQVNTDANE